MFPLNRQAKIDPILADLKDIKGVSRTIIDDWISSSVNIVIGLNVASYRFDQAGKAREFEAPLRSVKAAIKKVCQKHGVDMEFLDWPSIEYSFNYDAWDKKTEKIKQGYGSNHIKIELFL